MNRHVSSQALLLPELLPADAAGVHQLPAVLLHVSLQRRHVTEGPAALFTLEWFLCGVDTCVRRQVSLLAELLATDVAAVRFLSRVQSDMQLLCQDGLEDLPTEGAGFTPLLVRLQVSAQVISRVRTLATEAAAVVWVFGADLQDMFEQKAFPLQSSSTDQTVEALSRSRSFPFVPDAKQRPASLLLPW